MRTKDVSSVRNNDFENRSMKLIMKKVVEQPSIVQKKMMNNQEYERLKKLLQYRLTDCGWRAEVTKLCKDAVRSESIENTSVDDIVDQITPKARSLVPAAVKKELLQKIKIFLMQEADLNPYG